MTVPRAAIVRPVGVALGSNLGDRLAHLRAAVRWLKKLSAAPVHCSKVYETAPIGCPAGTPSFLNAVCEIASAEEPLALLRRMRDFERERGRAAVYERNTPRPLDLDLLYAGGETARTAELTLPHPRLLERRFVLQPLCDIRPELILPGQTLSVSKQLVRLKDDGDIHPLKESLRRN